MTKLATLWQELVALLPVTENTLVQIGANDRATLNDLIQLREWHGVLIEPVPFLFERLKVSIPVASGLLALNAAIHPSADRESMTFYSAKEHELDNKIVPGWFKGLSSFDLPTILSHEKFVPDIREHIEEITVQTRTSESLLNELE